ncbi:SAVED domain-containing protein [Bacillus halotolerans]|uniref:SAVED domain-containing protein n=1 Tax=Bacillus halotolerans TaxID=260554 RepID=UPI001D0DB02F|nr:SAVED domain-containing protein [Bacillus halotolerans]MCC2117372.1 SAVED domain-containing protein [Bacillus halotolerans]
MDQLLEYLRKFINIIIGSAEKKIALSLVTGGVSVIVASLNTDWLQILLMLVVKGLNKEATVTEGGSSIVGCFFGLVLVILGVWFYFKTNTQKKKKIVARIQHSSIEVVDFSNIKEESDTEVKRYIINQLEEMTYLSEIGLIRSIAIQNRNVNRLLDSFHQLDSCPSRIDYYGLAHIPFTILLGYQIADKVNVKFHEWDQNKSKWLAIWDNPTSYPKLILDINKVQKPREVEEVIIKVGMTYPIEDNHLDGLGLRDCDTYYLHLENPRRNHIVSLKQLQDYKKEFRDLLDRINQTYPNLKKIHLFYSGQMSFAYCIGSAFSSRMDYQVLSYNFVGRGYPKYNWVLPLKKAHENIEPKVTGEVVRKDV